MKRQQKETKENLYKMQERQCKRNSRVVKMCANFKNSSRYEEDKKADKVCKKWKTRALNFDSGNNEES